MTRPTTTVHHTDFAVVDAPRPVANTEFARTIFDHFGFLEGYVEKHDDWSALPIRLVHDLASGWHLELGPYSLDHGDVLLLRAAILAYDEATGRTGEDE